MIDTTQLKSFLEHLRDNVVCNNQASVAQINVFLTQLAQEVGEQPTPPATTADRRSEARDPGEEEQHLAEKLKLAPTPEPLKIA